MDTSKLNSKLGEDALELLTAKHKVQQIVWLPPEIYTQVVQLAEQLGIAANQAVMLLVAVALRGQPFVIQQQSASASAPRSELEQVKEYLKRAF